MKNKTAAPIAYLCLTICITFLVFYLLYSIKNQMVGNWLNPYMVTAALLVGYCFQVLHYKKSTLLLILFSALISAVIATNNVPRISFSIAKGYIYHHLMQEFNATYPILPKLIFTISWKDARMLYFLKDKPEIYTFDRCGNQQNEYAFWSQDFVEKVMHKNVKEALYMDRTDHIACVEKYFDRCVPLLMPNYRFKDQDYTIYAYKCMNHINA